MSMPVDEIEAHREAEKIETPQFSIPTGWERHLVTAVAVSFSAFQLYTAAFGLYEQYIQRSIHLAFAIALIALTYPLKPVPVGTPRRVGLADVALLALGVWSCLHMVFDYGRLMNRIQFVDALTLPDQAASVILILISLEICRRAVSPALALIAVMFIAYGMLGQYIPGFFGHAALDWDELLETMYLSPEGIFGIPIGVSATYVFVFVMFGGFVMRLGLMQLFVDFGMAVAGGSAGGPAKVAVICSALFGTISGSGLANAITVGSFTVPLMKKVGYRGHFAAGVESAASMGGNIMPPVMGAAAFIMADFLGMPYYQVAIAAVVPAFLYFFGIGAMVHFEALRTGIARLPKEELPKLGPAMLKRGHLLIPVAGMIYLLFDGRSAMLAGVAGIVLAFLVSMLKAETRMGPRKLVEILQWCAITALPVIAACAVVGIVIGIIAQTGVGVKVAGGIVAAAGGNMFLTLVMAMIASLLLGLGLPTTPNYIIAAALTAPALVQFGLPAIAAHLFVFYYGILADITPPTAITPFAVASIAKADPNKTCLAACMVASSGLIVPFIFAYEPAMLDPLLWRSGTTLTGFLSVTVSAVVGVVMLSAGMIGWLRAETTMPERIMLLVGAGCLIFPERITDLVGLALLALVWVLQGRRRPQTAKAS